MFAVLKQFKEFKAKYPDFVLFFHVNGEYVSFDNDALVTIHQMGHVANQLTLKSDDVKLIAAVPADAIEKCLRRMIASGHKVAICEPTP